jgi:hypothetical protein
MALLGSHRRWLWISATAVVVVAAAVVVVLVLATTRGNRTGVQFEKAAKAFHGQYNPVAEQLATDLGRASGGFGDASFLAAQQDARKLGDAYDAYGTALNKITFPEKARAAAAQLVKDTKAGSVVMVNAAGFFAKSGMQQTLGQYQRPVETAVDNDEKALRTALGLRS